MCRAKRITLLTGATVAVTIAAAAWTHRERIHFWWLFRPLERNEQGLREFLHRPTGIVFVLLPGGKFLMGSPPTERYRKDDELQHEVSLSPFLIAKYEVTQGEWKRIMGPLRTGTRTDDHPVEYLFWEDTEAFCMQTGLELPTEAQWEYACRAGSEGCVAGTGELEEMGWFRQNTRNVAQPVGQKLPNAFGLFDMHGNAEEWCADIYDADFYERPEASGQDPVCNSGTDLHVCRGGTRYHSAGSIRSAARRPRKAGPMNCAPGIRPAYYPLP